MAKLTQATLEATNESGKGIRVTIEGETDMPFWKHDLKLKAIKALLETVDMKDFYNEDKHEEFENHMNEIQEILDAVRGL